MVAPPTERGDLQQTPIYQCLLTVKMPTLKIQAASHQLLLV